MAATSSVAMERVEEPCDMHNVESVNVDLKTGRVSQIESEEEDGAGEEDPVAPDSISCFSPVSRSLSLTSVE